MDLVEDIQENYKTGYIKIFRSITDHWIWDDPVKLKWWIYMLLNANFKSKKVNIGNKLYDCNRGQSIRSLMTWAKKWNTSKDKVRNFFKLLENDNMILYENLIKTTRITICNYDSYNIDLHAIQTQSKRNPNAIQTQSHTNNNDNNVNNDNKYNSKFYEKQIKISEDNLQYIGFVDWLFKDNINKKPLTKVLSLTDQISYEMFNRYIKKYSPEQLKKTILSLENYTKKTYKSFNLTLNNWLKNEWN